MDYDLNSMEPATFETLSQSLFQGFLGPTCKIYGAGPDGQREAVCHIDNPLEILGRQVCGRTFLQAKHKDSQTKTSDFTWIKNQLKGEFEKLSEKKKTEPDYLPQNYFFFTNVVLTPVKKAGIKDRIDKYAEGLKGIVPNIFVIGYDEICSMLDNNSNVRQAYYSFLVSGDILSELYKWMADSQEKSHKELESSLLRFIECEFIGDMFSRLEQAGDLNDTRIALEKVFIDLVASPQGIADKISEKFISRIIREGNRPLNSFLEQSSPNSITNNKNRFVLLGGAGQGKSTIGQYLAQIYRATLLKLDNTCDASDIVNSFIKCFEKDYGYKIKCVRIPVRIILKDYAAWIKKNEDTSCGVLDYVVNQINNKASAKCETESLREFLKARSWIFIFDGLDEVPSSSNRAAVLEHIANFIDIELRRQNSDAIIMATTRQQGYNDDFSANNYLHLHLLEMNDKICLRYLDKLVTQLEPQVDERNNIMAILTDALKDPVVSKLMRRPLHASIVTILVRSGGKPPRDKYALFKEYTEIIIKRERQKNIYKALNEYESEITKIYEEAAYLLQEESGKPGNPAAVLSKPKLISLIKNRMSECGLENGNATEVINEIYTLAAFRLSYLSEVRDGELEFPIRSVQEYFAANFLIKHRPEEEIIKIIRHIASNGYWRNVLVFAVSYFIKEREHLEGTVDAICGELNGSILEPSDYDIHKGAQIGAWLALDLLNENIFANKPETENKYIKHAADILKLSYILPSTRKIVTLPQNSLGKFIKYYLKPFIEQFPCSKTAWVILWHLIESGSQLAIELAKDILQKPDADISSIFLCSHFAEHSMTKDFDWIAPYIINWLKKGNVFPSEKISFFGLPAFIEEINQNANDDIFMSGFIKSCLLAVNNLYLSSDKVNLAFSGCGINFDNLYAFLLRSKKVFISESVSYQTPVIALDESHIDLIKSINKVCLKLNLVFFKKWSDFLLEMSLQSLIEMVSAYYNEEESSKNDLKIYFEVNLLANHVLVYCIDRGFALEDTNKYITENYNTVFQSYIREYTEVKEDIELLRERKRINLYRYLNFSTSHTDTALQCFVTDLKVDPLEFPSYSDGFIELLIFVSVITSKVGGLKTLTNEENIKILRNVFDYYEDFNDASPVDRGWFRQFTIFWLAVLSPSEMPEVGYIKFQEAEPSFSSLRIELDEVVCSVVLKKILKRVVFDEKEHETLKIIPYILEMAITDICNTDIEVLQSIKCENEYNELGRLLICLFGNSEDTSSAFLELAKKLDILYISDCVSSVVSAHSISTQAAVNSIIALYQALKSEAVERKNIDDAISRLEKSMLELSSNAVCTPINRMGTYYPGS